MNRVDVEAAGRDVGCDQNLVLPALESLDRDAPLILAPIRVERGAAHAGGSELACQAIRAHLGTSEDQHRSFRPAQVIDQPVHLVSRPDRFDPVGDALGRRAPLSDLHVGRISCDLERVAENLVGQSRRKEQRLTRHRQHADDAAHVGPEPHVHHAVGLVENQQFDAGQIGVLLPHVIHQPAGCGDDDVDARLERALLWPHLDAAVDGGTRDGGVIREAVNLVLDLDRELARGREHQHARFSLRWGGPFDSRVLGALAQGKQRLQHRDDESGGLAASRLGTGDHVAAGERERDDGALNRPGVGPSEIPDAFEQTRIEAKAREGRRRRVARRRLERAPNQVRRRARAVSVMAARPGIRSGVRPVRSSGTVVTSRTSASPVPRAAG